MNGECHARDLGGKQPGRPSQRIAAVPQALAVFPRRINSPARLSAWMTSGENHPERHGSPPCPRKACLRIITMDPAGLETFSMFGKRRNVKGKANAKREDDGRHVLSVCPRQQISLSHTPLTPFLSLSLHRSLFCFGFSRSVAAHSLLVVPNPPPLSSLDPRVDLAFFLLCLGCGARAVCTSPKVGERGMFVEMDGIKCSAKNRNSASNRMA